MDECEFEGVTYRIGDRFDRYLITGIITRFDVHPSRKIVYVKCDDGEEGHVGIWTEPCVNKDTGMTFTHFIGKTETQNNDGARGLEPRRGA
jgi:hypothetical protein